MQCDFANVALQQYASDLPEFPKSREVCLLLVYLLFLNRLMLFAKYFVVDCIILFVVSVYVDPRKKSSLH